MAIEGYTSEATRLFERFAQRHGFRYEVERNAPIDLLWTFPTQDGLVHPIVLGLQNRDELNFGVDDFWSYFFPFQASAARFERIINAWVIGEARVAVTGRKGRVLQLWDDEKWLTVYSANRLLPYSGEPNQTVENRPLDLRANAGNNPL